MTDPCPLCGGPVRLPASECDGCGRRVIRPQPGPQSDFLAATEDFVLYGGAAGGGKSWALLADALRHGHNTAGWVGVIFRARATDIQGDDSIYADAVRLYEGTGARFRASGSTMDCRWPDGGRDLAPGGSVGADRRGQAIGGAFFSIVNGAANARQALAGLLQQFVAIAQQRAIQGVANSLGNAFGASTTQKINNLQGGGSVNVPTVVGGGTSGGGLA